MTIQFFSEDVDLPKFDQNKTKEWINKTANEENKETGDLNIIFCSDNYLLEINKKYLEHNYYTDIVAFDYTEEDKISGDLFISIDRVKKNAESYNVNFLNELHRVMIHGTLHLCGYKDGSDEEKKEMQGKENQYLEKINV